MSTIIDKKSHNILMYYRPYMLKFSLGSPARLIIPIYKVGDKSLRHLLLLSFLANKER